MIAGIIAQAWDTQLHLDGIDGAAEFEIWKNNILIQTISGLHDTYIEIEEDNAEYKYRGKNGSEYSAFSNIFVTSISNLSITLVTGNTHDILLPAISGASNYYISIGGVWMKCDSNRKIRLPIFLPITNITMIYQKSRVWYYYLWMPFLYEADKSKIKIYVFNKKQSEYGHTEAIIFALLGKAASDIDSFHNGISNFPTNSGDGLISPENIYADFIDPAFTPEWEAKQFPNLRLFINCRGNILGALSEVSLSRMGYPNVLSVIPLGDNYFYDLGFSAAFNNKAIVCTGAGDFLDPSQDRNNTGFGNGLDFWDHDIDIDNDSDASSFSTPIIAMKLFKIKIERGCGWYEAVYCAKMTADRNEPNRITYPWDLRNGYGRINVNNAIAYSGEIPIDPNLNHIGIVNEIAGERIGQSVSLKIAPITNATEYETRRNGILLSAQSGLAFVDIISSTARYDYRGKLDNGAGQLEYSDYSDSILIKLVHFKYIKAML